jgi:transposase
MYVAGIDAHATYSVVTIVSKQGERVQAPTGIRNQDADRLIELLDQHSPVEAVVETCPAWPWLYDLLGGEGHGFVLAHAKKLRAIAEANYKRDEIDSELLARMRLAGLIPEVYPKSIEQREQAVLLRHRAMLVRMRTAAVNRIHAQLHSVGLRLERGRLLTREGRRWIKERAWPVLGPEQRSWIRTQWGIIRSLKPLLRRLDRHIEGMGRELPAVALLRTIPGIGPYRGLLIATEVLPIERFRTPGHLVSYAGLAPRSSQSGLRPIRHGSIPAGANRWLRGSFVRAIVNHVALAPNSHLTSTYEETKKRLGWQVARVATARRLARAVHAMLRTGEVWRDRPTNGDRGELRTGHVASTTRASD